MLVLLHIRLRLDRLLEALIDLRVLGAGISTIKFNYNRPLVLNCLALLAISGLNSERVKVGS